MGRKKRGSNVVGWAILGLLALGIVQFGIMPERPRQAAPASDSKPAAASTQSRPTVPLSQPRYVSVASLNVRHTPSATGALITALPRGTALKVLDRQDGWLLIDLNPTLEGWVTERFTTTEGPGQRYLPPASLRADR